MSDFKRVKLIFEELIELPLEGRAEALDRSCDGDPDLRAAVERLLASHEQAGAFLGAPTLEHGGISTAQTGGTAALPPRIASYTPLEVIGEGGFGTVYRARQESPVRRIVALKVIKPGMDTREVITRFESERQALAMMSHTNIAAVLDAGATPEGRPYFVMEYVPGEPITAYCDKRSLQLRERIELFIQVCDAIQHAHQKGIIHRDIKPSNVMVVEQSADAQNAGERKGRRGDAPKAVVKVIDFGVAKAIEQRLTEHTLYTREGVLLGTPEYMSPEQADTSRLDIDTRTDIYSLGVLLYELLTGTLPFSPRTLRSKGYAEIQRIVREIEPSRPSQRLSALMSADRGKPGSVSSIHPPLSYSKSPGAMTQSAAEIARRRRTDPRALIRSVRGDLDWIVMKCLEKDRARRYDTAHSVALEVSRYLRNEPVLAGPPEAVYRLRKFVRRNRAALTVVSATIAALAVSIAGLVAAVRARDVAEQQEVLARLSAEDAGRAARTAEAVNRFLQDMLSEADPRFSGRAELTVREALDRAVARLDGGAMRGEPEVEAAIRLTIGRSYSGLAEFAAAEAQIEAATRAFRDLSGEDSAQYAEALHERGCVRKFSGRSVEAEPDLRAALAIQRSLGEVAAAEAATCENDLALALLDQNQPAEGEALLRNVLAFARRPENAGKPILAEAVNNMGSVFLARREFDEAEPLFREAIEINRRILGGVHPNVATNLDNLAQVLHGKDDLEGAQSAYQEALAIRRKLFGAEHPDVATTLHNLAVLLYARSDTEGCEKALRESLAIFRRAHGLAHAETQTVVDSLVSVVGGGGRFDEAEGLLLEAFDALRGDSPEVVHRRQVLAERLVQLYQAWQKPEKAHDWSLTVESLRTSGLATAPERASTR